jgi:hypothetical protein
MALDRDEVKRALVRAYCHLPNRNKSIDRDLVDEMADEIMVLIDNILARSADGDALRFTAAALSDRRH